jgi:uncharacterized protein
MHAMTDGVVRRPSVGSFLAFLVLTTGISWAAWVPAVLFAAEVQLAPADSVALNFLQALGAAGPSLAAILVLRAEYGPRWRDLALFRRYRRWRVGPAWWLFAAFAIPGITLVAVALRSIVLGQPPAPGSSLAELIADVGIVGVFATLIPQLVGLMLSSPLLEELGWRGFALPRLQERMPALPAAIVLGFIWGVWHLPLWFAYGTVVPYELAMIVLHSILITAAFNSTGGSLLLAMVFHASLAVGLTSFASGGPNPFELGLTLLVTVAVVASLGARDLARRDRVRWRELATRASAEL